MTKQLRPRRLVRCPRCNGTRVKRVKTAVVLGKVELFCLLCGYEFHVEITDWRRRAQARED